MAGKFKYDDLIRAVVEGDETSAVAVIACQSSPGSIDLMMASNVENPFVAACENRNARMVERLLSEKLNPNVVSRSGNFALRAAVLSGEGPLIMALLDSGADPNVASSRGSALSAAASSGEWRRAVAALPRMPF